MYDKTKYIYVGLDLRKEQQTAVIMNCFNEKLGEITFQNKPSEFGKLILKCKKYCSDGKEIVFALECVYLLGSFFYSGDREVLFADDLKDVEYKALCAA